MSKISLRERMMRSRQPSTTPSIEEPAAPPPTVVRTVKPSSILESIFVESHEIERAVLSYLDRVSYDNLRSSSRYLLWCLPTTQNLYRSKVLSKWIGPSCYERRNPLWTFERPPQPDLSKVDELIIKYLPPITQPIPCQLSVPMHRTPVIRCDYDIAGHHKLGSFYFCKRCQKETSDQLDEFTYLMRGVIYELCDRCVWNRLKSAESEAVPEETRCECKPEFNALIKRTKADQNKCRLCCLRPFFDWHLENRRIKAEQEHKVQNCWRHPVGPPCDCKTCIGCHEVYNAGPGGDWRCGARQCGHCKKGTVVRYLPAAVYSEGELRTWESESSKDDASTLPEFFRLFEISESPSV